MLTECFMYFLIFCDWQVSVLLKTLLIYLLNLLDWLVFSYCFCICAPSPNNHYLFAEGGVKQRLFFICYCYCYIEKKSNIHFFTPSALFINRSLTKHSRLFLLVAPKATMEEPNNSPTDVFENRSSSKPEELSSDLSAQKPPATLISWSSQCANKKRQVITKEIGLISTQSSLKTAKFCQFLNLWRP